MKMLDCIKMIMRVQGVTEKRAAKWKRCSQQTINVLLNGKDIKCGQAVEMLEYMGFELIVREKRPRYRDEDEIIIDYDSGDVDVEKLMEIRSQEMSQKIRAKRYAEIEKELSAEFPLGMRRSEISGYFEKSLNWVDNHFPREYYIDHRFPVEHLIQILRDDNL